MPYAIKGNSVVKRDSGKVVGHSSNPKKYMRVLNAVEHGWKPTHKRGFGGAGSSPCKIRKREGGM